jgi:hypothetical protein
MKYWITRDRKYGLFAWINKPKLTFYAPRYYYSEGECGIKLKRDCFPEITDSDWPFQTEIEDISKYIDTKFTMYVARDKNNDLAYFFSKPVYNSLFESWNVLDVDGFICEHCKHFLSSESSLFRHLTLETSPIKIEFDIPSALDLSDCYNKINNIK